MVGQTFEIIKKIKSFNFQKSHKTVEISIFKFNLKFEKVRLSSKFKILKFTKNQNAKI